MINKAEKLAKAIEFTHLDNTATIEEMKAFFAKAKEYPFYAVVVLPHFVKLAKEELKDTDMKVVTVIDFPLGAGNTEGKGADLHCDLPDKGRSDCVRTVSAKTREKPVFFLVLLPIR